MGLKARDRPLWTCPQCGRKLVTANMFHSCSSCTEADFLVNRTPRALAIYGAFREAVMSLGGVFVSPAKTRVSFQVKIRFAGVERIGREHITATLVLTRPLESPRFRVELIPPRYYLHRIRLETPTDIDDTVIAALREAHAIGRRLHVG